MEKHIVAAVNHGIELLQQGVSEGIVTNFKSEWSADIKMVQQSISIKLPNGDRITVMFWESVKQ